MLTIDALKEYGADVAEGLTRCVNNEALYLRLVGKAANHEAFGKLEEAIASSDLEAGFQAAHALKGVVGNLALTPIRKPVEEITELLRAKQNVDYAPLLKQIKDAHEKLLALL